MIVWSLAKREADTEMRQRQIVFAFPNEGKKQNSQGTSRLARGGLGGWGLILSQQLLPLSIRKQPDEMSGHQKSWPDKTYIWPSIVHWPAVISSPFKFKFRFKEGCLADLAHVCNIFPAVVK